MNAKRAEDVALDALVGKFLAAHPNSAARSLASLPAKEAAGLLNALPTERFVLVWESMAPNAGAEIMLCLSAEHRATLAKRTDLGKLTILLSRLEPADREAVLNDMADSDAAELRSLLEYPLKTAGRLMDTHIAPLKSDMTAGEAIDTLRRQGRVKATSELRLIDHENKLVSILDMRVLALAEPTATLSSLAHGITAVVNPMDPEEEVVDKLERFKLEELPVVDSDGVLLGVVRHAELIDVLKEAASVDIQTMVGASKDERATSTSWFAFRKRMPWLQVNLLTAFMAAAVVGVFEDTIARFTALAVLLPVVAGQSGNAGAQALAVTMRGLALREIRIGQWLRVMLKEVNVGLWNGIAIAITCGIGVYFWSGQIGLVIVIASSMVIAMVAAGIAGALVPITLKKLGQDPAVASSIILTTVTDIAGFFSFLGIATMMSSMLS